MKLVKREEKEEVKKSENVTNSRLQVRSSSQNDVPPPRASAACVWVVLSAIYTTVAQLFVSYPLRTLVFFPSFLEVTGTVSLLQQKVCSLTPVLAGTKEEIIGGQKTSDEDSVIHAGILSAKSQSVIIKLTNPVPCWGMMYASF